MRRLLIGLALLAFAGCNETTDPVETAEIELLASTFDPPTITVSRGTEVTWINTLAIEHTITPDNHTQWEKQDMTTNGQRFTVKLEVPGTWAYYCELHAGMQGTIIVTAD